MGFPNWQAWGESTDDKYAIKELHSEIGNSPVKVEMKEIGKKSTDKPWAKRGTKIAEFDAAFVWPVSFKPKEKLTVKTSFSFGGFDSNGPFDALDYMPKTYPKIRKADTFWSVRKPKGKDVDYANATVGAAAYITTTGLTWRGPIEDAEIVFELPNWLSDSPHFMIPLPTGYEETQNQIRWHFHDYVPKSELAIYYLRHIADAVAPGIEFPDQAKAWAQFASKSKVAPEVYDRLIAISENPKVKAVLEKAKRKTAQKKP